MKTEELIAEVLNSKTLQKAGYFAAAMPIDVMNEAEFKHAITTCTIEIAKAIDSGIIKLGGVESGAHVHGLLALCMSRCVGGKQALRKVVKH